MAWLRILCVLYLLIVLCRGQTRKEAQALETILSGYNNILTPTLHENNDNATVVNCSISIRSLWSISHKTMDFQTDLYLYAYWYDRRLDHDNFSRILDINDKNMINKVWLPDLYFPNSKTGSFHEVAVPNRMFRIYPADGKVMLFIRCTMTFACMMDLRKYPFDSQICTMEISTVAKTDKEVKLTWDDDTPLRAHQKMKTLPEFDIKEMEARECDEHYSIGNYSCLEARIYLKRRIGYHLVQNYIPTILIVIISWVSFWMDVDAVPGRVCLGITTLLTVTSKVTGVQQSMPEVSYVKAIDIWMGSCTAFVFCSLCEFIVANHQWRMEKQAANKVQCAPEGKSDPLSGEAAGLVIPKRIVVSGKKVDKVSRIVFPVLFALFNLVYWPFYLA